MMFPLSHGLVSGGDVGDTCLVPASWSQPYSDLDLSALDNRTHGMVAMSETDFAYWDRGGRRWQRYRRSAGVYSAVGTASDIVSFTLISADKLSDDRIVFYDHNIRDLRTIEWSPGTETWALVPGMTSDGPSISASSPLPIAGMSPSRCALASNGTGLVCYESDSDGPWTPVGNPYTAFGDPAVELAGTGMAALDENTVALLAKASSGTGPGLLILEFDGVDWNLVQSIASPAHFRPSSLAKLNSKTFAIVGAISVAGRELQLYCYAGGSLSASGVPETIVGGPTPVVAPFNDALLGYIDEDGLFKTYQRN